MASTGLSASQQHSLSLLKCAGTFLNIVCLDGMRSFLHFICASLFFCVYFRRSKDGACLLLSVFSRLRMVNALILFLSTLLRGGFLFQLFSFRAANTRLNHVVRVSNHMQNKTSTGLSTSSQTRFFRSKRAFGAQVRNTGTWTLALFLGVGRFLSAKT